jgi:hypothetical protein
MKNDPKEAPKAVFSKEELERFDTFFGSDPDYALLAGFEINGVPVNLVVKQEKGDRNFTKIEDEENPDIKNFEFLVDASFISAPADQMLEILSNYSKAGLTVNNKIVYKGDGVFSVGGVLTTIPPEEAVITSEEDDESTVALSFNHFMLALKEEDLDEGEVYNVLEFEFSDVLTRIQAVVEGLASEDVLVIGDRYIYALLSDQSTHNFLEMEPNGDIPALDTIPPFNFCFIVVTSKEAVFGDDEKWRRRTKALQQAARQDCASFVVYMYQNDELAQAEFNQK